MTEQLKPCPFCGAIGEPIKDGDRLLAWEFKHEIKNGLYACPFRGRDLLWNSPLNVKQWNRRAEQGELAMIVRSLLHLLAIYDATHPSIDLYKDYLSRHGLQGDPLREPPQ